MAAKKPTFKSFEMEFKLDPKFYKEMMFEMTEVLDKWRHKSKWNANTESFKFTLDRA
jgi:hypothetical protein